MPAPTTPIRLLLVEDSEPDAELVLDELERGQLAVLAERVDDEPAFVRALEATQPDLIISDLSMPGFSGYRALEIARERAPSIPFMFVSGTMGEDAAVDALHAGATDYVLKHNLARLAAAARRALAEAAERKARERSEQDLMRTQRYESLALLASGLSHDLRNVLQPISMAAAWLHDDPRDEVRKAGQLVAECAQRGLDIVASMLSFARGSHAGDERVDLRGLVDGLATLLRGSIPPNVRLQLAPIAADIELEGNHTELQQVLLNLCLNALQAMPEGGELRISTTSVDLDADFFDASEEACEGRYLAIDVTDTGIGMPEHVRSRLFEPFFTTKATGTGLGLLSCRRIIGNHRGCLRVSSVPGKGTTFTVYLPLLALRERALTIEDVPRGRGERVLIVIERAGKLSLLGSIVEDHGYVPTLAQDGALALQSLDRDGMPDAVLMEAQMTLLTGVRTSAALLERGYAGPVLLIARRDAAESGEELPPLRRVRRIDKPVDPIELLATLDEELHPMAEAERSP